MMAQADWFLWHQHLPSWKLCNFSMAMDSCLYPKTNGNDGHWILGTCAFPSTPFPNWFWCWLNYHSMYASPSSGHCLGGDQRLIKCATFYRAHWHRVQLGQVRARMDHIFKSTKIVLVSRNGIFLKEARRLWCGTLWCVMYLIIFNSTYKQFISWMVSSDKSYVQKHSSWVICWECWHHITILSNKHNTSQNWSTWQDCRNNPNKAAFWNGKSTKFRHHISQRHRPPQYVDNSQNRVTKK